MSIAEEMQRAAERERSAASANQALPDLPPAAADTSLSAQMEAIAREQGALTATALLAEMEKKKKPFGEQIKEKLPLRENYADLVKAANALKKMHLKIWAAQVHDKLRREILEWIGADSFHEEEHLETEEERRWRRKNARRKRKFSVNAEQAAFDRCIEGEILIPDYNGEVAPSEDFCRLLKVCNAKNWNDPNLSKDSILFRCDPLVAHHISRYRGFAKDFKHTGWAYFDENLRYFFACLNEYMRADDIQIKSICLVERMERANAEELPDNERYWHRELIRFNTGDWEDSIKTHFSFSSKNSFDDGVFMICLHYSIRF